MTKFFSSAGLNDSHELMFGSSRQLIDAIVVKFNGLQTIGELHHVFVGKDPFARIDVPTTQ